jgi:high affinity Mn2+ porin
MKLISHTLLTVFGYFAMYIVYTEKVSAQNPKDSSQKNWSFHFQQTIVEQYQPGVPGSYQSDFSLSKKEEDALSLTTTFFIGRRLWKGAQVFFNPELAGGSGLSYARGVAGFPNGETFRIGDPKPQTYIARLFITQKFSLNGNQNEFSEDEANSIQGKEPSSYISVSAGKFSMADYFDCNQYSHDPRSQFLNWSLMSTGAWDYPANTRGYTYGFVLQYVTPNFAVRYAASLVPTYANGPNLDWNISQYNAHTAEVQQSFKINKRRGTIRVLGFYNLANMGNYNEATQLKVGIDTVRNGARTKYGFGINLEQELTDNVGLFARASWNDGTNETWAFTEIDQSISAGILVDGKKWKRASDRFGLAVVGNGISTAHQNYLKGGGKGFMIGDGNLNYGYEMIAEIYYSTLIHQDHFWLTPDYQFIMNPAYNKDRGPAHVFGLRFHAEF